MSTTLKPRFDPLLWAQLRPSVISARKAGGEDASQALSVGNVPLVPENRIATSLRVVLHDTKSVMEQFSDRLENLFGGVDQAKQQIDKVNNKFESGHDKILEELVSTVNRHQKGLLEVIDTPAQASALDQVKSLQTETLKHLERLETKVDFCQNNLQTVSEQQGQILTCLAGLTPLASPLQDIPQQLHDIKLQLSTLQPLCQTLPDQLKLVQHETSTQNVQSIISAFSAAFSTSLEKHLESLGRIISESTKLITATVAKGPCNFPERTAVPVVCNRDTMTETVASCESQPSLKRPRQDMNAHSDQSNHMVSNSQSEQEATNTNSPFDGSNVSSSCSSGPRETHNCNKQKSKRPRLVNTAANSRKKPAKSTSKSKRKRKTSITLVADTDQLPAGELNADFVNPMHKTTEPVKLASYSSGRILRPRVTQPTSLTLSERNDKVASISTDTNTFTNSNDRFLVPPPPRIHHYSSVVPTPISRRRTLIPAFPDSEPYIEVDWEELNQI